MTPYAIIAVTAAEFGLTSFDLIGPKKLARLAGPRQALARRLRGRRYSVLEIGEFMNRHHTTIVAMLAGGKAK